MTQECILIGRITRLAIFRVAELAPVRAFTSNVPGGPRLSAPWPAMSPENSLLIIAKATSWS